MRGLHRLLSHFESRLACWRTAYYRQVYSNQVFLHPTVRLGKFSSVSMNRKSPTSRLTIGKGSRFRRFCLLTLDADGEIFIGENTFFNNGCAINCLGEVSIGSNTLFGESVKVYDHNHIFNKPGMIVEDQGLKIGTVKIGDNCWIGSNCLILNNVTIGDNVVIGAGCVITQSIASSSIVRLEQNLAIETIVYRAAT